MKLFNRGPGPFAKKPKRDIPTDLWTKCEACGQLLYNKALEENLRVCTKCDFHFSLTARQRIDLTVDEATFEEWDADLTPLDPLEFSVPRPYAETVPARGSPRSDAAGCIVPISATPASASTR